MGAVNQNNISMVDREVRNQLFTIRAVKHIFLDFISNIRHKILGRGLLEGGRGNGGADLEMEEGVVPEVVAVQPEEDARADDGRGQGGRFGGRKRTRRCERDQKQNE